MEKSWFLLVVWRRWLQFEDIATICHSLWSVTFTAVAPNLSAFVVHPTKCGAYEYVSGLFSFFFAFFLDMPFIVVGTVALAVLVVVVTLYAFADGVK